jgi:CRISPR-associated endonuclease/helicase Cas3
MNGREKKMTNIFTAHIRDDGVIQSAKEHLEGTAALAGKFADKFGAGEYARFCGILHDIGKYSKKFQKRIRGLNIQTDHSTAGAVEINRLFNGAGFLLAYCVAGHHSGLPDGGSPVDTGDEPTLRGRLKKKIEQFSSYKDEIIPKQWIPKRPPEIRPTPDNQGFSLSFFIRMIYSCLVDADFLDTEGFMSGKCQPVGMDMECLSQLLLEYIKAFENPTKQINRFRTEILHRCLEKAEWDRGLYTLTVPTGGGKTVSSLSFAIEHAKAHNMDRIIYVIPYNSIIEQNAGEFRKILGAENVLEHHSNFIFDDKDEILHKQRLATENWDMPVIVTTTVQFFESLFSNRSSHCRKLHNIANSVIIFDEAQMIPIPYLKPCVQAISELVLNYRSTAVLCSATQPALEGLFPKELPIKEICGDTQRFYKFFKRTEFVHLGELSDEELAERMNGHRQVLCIVGTRKQAQSVFKLLKGDGCFHLSTLMYPSHRKSVIASIRQRLKKGQPCRVISTSLIEAGVDVDFPVVYRAEAGLDSMIQAAGRCNRENKNAISPVYIFKPVEEYRKTLPAMLKRPLSVARSVIDRYDDASSPEAINEYFKLLYEFEGEGLDSKKIVERFNEGEQRGMSFPFAQIAEDFKLIEDATRAVIIPADETAKNLLLQIKRGESNRDLMRKIQQYAVNVYDRHYEALRGMGAIFIIDDEGLAELVDEKRYDKHTGLDCSIESGVGIFY